MKVELARVVTYAVRVGDAAIEGAPGGLLFFGHSHQLILQEGLGVQALFAPQAAQATTREESA